MLLSSDGLTTTLLEALAGESLRLHCLAQLRAPAHDTGDGVPALLRIDGGGEVLVRYSATTRRDGRALSVNHVVARVDLSPAVEPCLTSTSLPLGPALHAAGTGHRRTLLDAGRRAWRGEGGPGRPACFKTYLLWHGAEPLALVDELFSPDAVAAA
jgi:chorismate-pyruvate lyase